MKLKNSNFYKKFFTVFLGFLINNGKMRFELITIYRDIPKDQKNQKCLKEKMKT